jgi:outer membrane protein
MNKTKLTFVTLSTGLLIVFIAGCDISNTQTFVVPAEKLRQVEAFKPVEKKKQPAQQEPTVETPPEEVELSIEKCRAAALEYNLDLKAQLIAPVIAQEGVNQEKAKFEWVFNGGVSKSITDTPLLNRVEGSTGNSIYTNLGVAMPLQTGGNLSFNLIDSYYETDSTIYSRGISFSNDMVMSISQPLLKGAGKQNNTHSIRIAQYDSNIVDAQTKLQIISVLAASERTYWRLYEARRQLQLRQDEYNLANAQLERAKNLVEAGQLPKIEILRAQAGLAQTLQSIIAAENLTRQRQRELKRALNIPGLDVDTNTKIIITTLPNPVDYQFNSVHLMDAAIENRMDLLELEYRLASNSSSIDYLKNMTLPAVSVDYRYNINGLGSTRKNSFDMIADKNYEDHRFGLNVQIPLGNRVAKSALLQAKFQRMQILASKQGKVAMVQVELFAAIDNAKAAWQQILASRQTAILQGQVYEAEIRQFKTGLRTSTDVLEAQAAFANAQSVEISALVEYQISLVDMAEATGTVLGAAKIEWQLEMKLPL